MKARLHPLLALLLILLADAAAAADPRQALTGDWWTHGFNARVLFACQTQIWRRAELAHCPPLAAP